jgi:hypothetical protein
VECQQAKAGMLPASHCGSRPPAFPIDEGPERARPFGGPDPGPVIPGSLPA